MTITLRYIASSNELEARWPEIWPLLDALHRQYADMVRKEFRPRREERAYESILSGLQDGDYWLLLAEQGEEIMAVGSVAIHQKGRTNPGPVGETGNLYIKEPARGQGLSARMREVRHETLRERGITLAEAVVFAANTRALELWKRKESWGCTLRRPLPASVSARPTSVRRVKDFDEEWAGLWPLLQLSRDLSEGDARKRVEAILAKRGAIFVAGERPAGVCIGQISVNPWLFVERVGVVTDLRVEDGADDELSAALLGRTEQWMLSKEATDIETLPTRHGEYDAWIERGFQPNFFWYQERL